MAKKLNIIGVCPFCHRDVGSDMRPISDLDAEQMDQLLIEMSDCQPSTSVESASQVVESSSSALTSTSTLNDAEIPLKEAVSTTDCILKIVKTEFERPTEEEVSGVYFSMNTEKHIYRMRQSMISEQQAKLILDLLMDEQRNYNTFLNSLVKKKSLEHKD
ncbi:hypothetical protein KR222_007842 [Zaprionus bogoriensis]|nr:hypothetical protein KR222_007842 [Zaprionus bogoriensis]